MHTQDTAVPKEQGTTGSGSGRIDRIAYIVAEVAALLGKHSNTVYGWVRSGALRAERIGNTIYIPKWALARLISPDADHVLAAAANPTSLRMQPLMTAARIQRPDWTGDAHRSDHRMAMVAEPVNQAVQNPLTRAGGMLRHLAQPSRWLCGAQDDAVDPRTATEDLRGWLPGARRSAYPAERAVQPLPPRLLLPEELEVLPCW